MSITLYLELVEGGIFLRKKVFYNSQQFMIKKIFLFLWTLFYIGQTELIKGRLSIMIGKQILTLFGKEVSPFMINTWTRN